jgi:hypothetical protein
MVQAEHDRHGQRKVRRGLLALVLAVAQLLVVGTASEVAQAAVPAGSSQYVALTPFRLTDTRPHAPFGYSAINHNTIRINITGKPGVPANATAAVINITLINSSGPGYISAFPSGSSVPNTSNVNADKAGQVIANLAHVRIGAGGNIDVLRSMGAYIAVDLVGVYVPVASDASSGRLVTLATGAKRVLDTRQRGYPVGANLVTGVDLTAANVPTTASAVVVNVTAVGAQKGFWTAYAAGAVRPEVSSLNVDTAGQTRPAQAIVPLNGNSSIYVYTQFGGHLLVDVVGWYTGASDVTSSNGLFIAAPTPLRVFDTRTLRTLAPWGNSTYEFTTGQAPTLPVAAVAMNVTGTSPWDRGFVTAHPAGVPRPDSSNLNITGWPQTIANHSVVRLSTRGAALYTNSGLHMIADVAGWYLGHPPAATTPVPVNPNYNPNKATAVFANKIGMYAPVKSGGGSLDYIADQGYAATWSDLTNVATPGNVMLFGHRTTGSAPFRYINGLKPGDGFTLVGSDGHYYNYTVVHTTVTSPYYSSIAPIAAFFPPVTAQLVACSKLDGSATSTAYRIVVTGRLVSVT